MRELVDRQHYWSNVFYGNTGYPSCFAYFLWGMISIRVGFDTEFSFGLSETQTENLDRLIDSLKGRDIQEADYEDPADFSFPELHNLLWSLVGKNTNSSWGGPFERYLWLRALKEDGNFSDISHITPMIAKLKHLINVVALVQLRHESEVQAGHDGGDDDSKASDIE